MARNKRIAEMEIRSLGDLVELTNRNVLVFDKRFKKLSKSSRNTKIGCAIMLGCIMRLAIECWKQDERIYNLSVRVRKLENNEGE